MHPLAALRRRAIWFGGLESRWLSLQCRRVLVFALGEEFEALVDCSGLSVGTRTRSAGRELSVGLNMSKVAVSSPRRGWGRRGYLSHGEIRVGLESKTRRLLLPRLSLQLDGLVLTARSPLSLLELEALVVWQAIGDLHSVPFGGAFHHCLKAIED